MVTVTWADNHKVNFLVVYDEGNQPAMQGIMAAVKYLEQNTNEGVMIGKQVTMTVKKGEDIEDTMNLFLTSTSTNQLLLLNPITGEDIEATVNQTCDRVDAMLDSNEAPHIVLDATTTGMMSETIKSFTRALALPTLSATYGQEGDIREWRDLSEMEEKYLIQLMPPGDVIVQSIRDIVATQNMTNAGIIYDHTFVMDHKYKSLLMNLPCRHIMTMAEDTEAGLRKQTKRLMDADIVNFFAVGSQETISRILDAATANDLFGRKYAWYAVSKGDEDIQCGCENSTVVFLRPQTTPDTRGRLTMLQRDFDLTAEPIIDSAFYFDYAVRGLKAAARMAEMGKYDNFNYIKCEAFDEDNPPVRDDFDLMDALMKVSMINTWADVKWNRNGENMLDTTLTIDKFKILAGRTAERKTLGMAKAGMPHGQLVFTAGQSLTEFQVVTVYRVTTVQQPPFIMKRMNEDGEEEFYGYCIDLINEIKQIVEFEYEIYEAPDGKFGNMNEKEEWNGMVLELMEKRADIALAPLSVMAERENVVDFTVPYYDLVGITILMKKPKVPTSLFKFLTVLEPEVWVCILFAYGFTSVLLYIFDRFSPYSYQNNKDKYKDDDEKREFTFKECLWFCMTSLTPQGGGEAPKNLSGRLVAATWWLFGFIIIASYTANLAAFLTVSRLDTPIESLDDLSNQYKVQYAPMNGSSTMTYFERMAYIEHKFYEIWKDMSLNDSLSNVERAKLAVWDYPVSDKYTKMWQSMQESGLPDGITAAIDRVRKSTSSSEGFAYIGEATEIRYAILTSCDVMSVGDEFSRKPFAIAVTKGSPLKDQLSGAILKLLNQRKLETLKERWWNQNPEKKVCEKDDDQSDGISIENIGGVFIVIFVGIGLACVTLAFEYWWYKHRKGPRVTDSAKVLSVRPTDQKAGFGTDKSNFNTEYNGGEAGYDIAPVAGPW
ncbi:hypothetical protein Pmani_026414 [Petrolisthes manimaculis]|uniref:Ionotropic receptor 25a n=1 Tax=Petrolisthes manimaculis TaxID=1843537 RepID=A0AAE1TWN8_9EUCA|nr:hypothetical protein Pmani_026414 [Petrolisthes manimaculis]